jgi:hypothetical protein
MNNSEVHISIAYLSVKDDIYEKTYQPLKMNMLQSIKITRYIKLLMSPPFHILTAVMLLLCISVMT